MVGIYRVYMDVYMDVELFWTVYIYHHKLRLFCMSLFCFGQVAVTNDHALWPYWVQP